MLIAATPPPTFERALAFQPPSPSSSRVLFNSIWESPQTSTPSISSALFTRAYPAYSSAFTQHSPPTGVHHHIAAYCLRIVTRHQPVRAERDSASFFRASRIRQSSPQHNHRDFAVCAQPWRPLSSSSSSSSSPAGPLMHPARASHPAPVPPPCSTAQCRPRSISRPVGAITSTWACSTTSSGASQWTPTVAAPTSPRDPL